MKQTLSKHEIIRKRKEIERVLKQGLRIQTENVILRFSPAQKKRVAFLIPKLIKTAVMRNSIRRRLKEGYRLNQDYFREGFEYIFQARPNAQNKSFRELQEEMLTLAQGVTRDT